MITITPGYTFSGGDVVTPARLNRAIIDQQTRATYDTLLGVPSAPTDGTASGDGAGTVVEIPCTPQGRSLLAATGPADLALAMADALNLLLDSIHPVGATYITMGANPIPAPIANLGTWTKTTTISDAPGTIKDIDAPDLATALAQNPGWAHYDKAIGQVIAGADPNATDPATDPNSKRHNGTQTGEETHTLALAEMAAHNHTGNPDVSRTYNDAQTQAGSEDKYINNTQPNGVNPGNPGLILCSTKGSQTTSTGTDTGGSGFEPSIIDTPVNIPTQGSDQPHNNMQPTLYLFKLIKLPTDNPQLDTTLTLWTRTE